MKHILFFLSFIILSNIPQISIAADQVTPGTGCIWNEKHGNCLISNNENYSILCQARLEVTTKNNQKVTKIEIELDPKTTWHSVKFLSPWADKILNAKIAAICKSI